MTNHALELPAEGAPRAWVRRPRSYWGGVATRLSRDPVTLVCGTILIAIVLAAIFAPYLDLADPYKTSVIRRLKPPGTEGYPLGTGCRHSGGHSSAFLPVYGAGGLPRKDHAQIEFRKRESSAALQIPIMSTPSAGVVVESDSTSCMHDTCTPILN